MDDDSLVIASAAFIVLNERTRRRRKRRWWMTSLYLGRSLYGGTQLMNDLQREPEYKKFYNFVRMSHHDFMWLLSQIEPNISKRHTNYREAIPALERLAITLRFLATGDSYTSLSYLFRVSKQLISEIVPEVCSAIIATLDNEVKLPSTSAEWTRIADMFEEKWNFPQCIGAIDGKHCLLQNPFHGGSNFINYKSSFSIVLLGVADADYCFTYANVGCQGRISDGGVLKNTEFYKKLQNNQLNLPQDKALPNCQKKVPYVFVADDAFSLQEHIMKPYPGLQEQGSCKRVYNYRLSRARRIIENVFGILSSVFRVLRKPLLLQSDRASTVIMACIYLHNFLRKSRTSRHMYTPSDIFDHEENGQMIDGSWRRQDNELQTYLFQPLSNVPGRSAASVEEIRSEYANYFSTVGQVPWQNNYV